MNNGQYRRRLTPGGSKPGRKTFPWHTPKYIGLKYYIHLWYRKYVTTDGGEVLFYNTGRTNLEYPYRWGTVAAENCRQFLQLAAPAQYADMEAYFQLKVEKNKNNPNVKQTKKNLDLHSSIAHAISNRHHKMFYEASSGRHRLSKEHPEKWGEHEEKWVRDYAAEECPKLKRRFIDELVKELDQHGRPKCSIAV